MSLPTHLPGHWHMRSFRDLGRWVGGGTPSKRHPEFWSVNGLPWVSPKDMKTVRISDAKDHITYEALASSTTNLVPGGSILVVTRSGILEHALPVAITETPVAINQDMKALTPLSDFDPWFLYFAFKRYEKQILATCTKSGTTVANISFNEFLKFRIPVPPLDEQRSIVAIIEELFSRLDTASLSVDASESRAQNIVPAMLDSLLGDAQATSLTNVLTKVNYGTSQKAAYDAPGVPVLRIPNIRNGSIDLTDLKHLVAVDANVDATTTTDDDVLFVRSNGSRSLIGRCACVGSASGYAFASYLIRGTVNRAIAEPDFVARMSTLPKVRRQIVGLAASTAGQYNLSIPAIRSIAVPLPSLARQREILARILDMAPTADRLAQGIFTAKARTNMLRQSILSAAFSGKLKANGVSSL